MNLRHLLVRILILPTWLALTAGLVDEARAEGRAGVVEWSDGRSQAGAISLTPGSFIRLFDGQQQTSLRLEDVVELTVTIEKEELAEGFFFPEPGKAAKEKTGEVFPVRYFQTRLTMGDGRLITGHVFTTVFYLETAENTEKVVLLAKQTGLNRQKLTDVVYPTSIRFNVPPASAAAARIDLKLAELPEVRRIVAVVKPALGFLRADQEAGSKTSWTVPSGDPAGVIFAAECADGLHVAWPAPKPEDAPAQQAVTATLQVMDDFYDTRTLLASTFDAETGDVYGIVYMRRVGKSHGMKADTQPWSVVVLHWQFEPEEKKATLLNRVTLATGRKATTAEAPRVFAEAGLLKTITLATTPNAASSAATAPVGSTTSAQP